jgi:opacity protein-like surface antigen
MKRIATAGSIILGTAIVVATAAPSLAADMAYPVIGSGPTTSVEFGSGWYLRGDIGYSVHSGSRGTYYSSAYGDDTDYASESLGGNESYSIGAGYIFNNMLRGDITLEHNEGVTWEGRSKSADCGTVPGDCLFEAEAELKRTSIMANGYYTVGNFAGFRPYVGGGIGISDVSWNDYGFQQLCQVDPGEDCDFGTHSGVGTDRETYYGPAGTVSTNNGIALTYALAAGLDYRINKNWVVDMGYKWTHISDNIMIKEDADGPGVPGGDSSFNAIDLHEVKIGLRYEIW